MSVTRLQKVVGNIESAKLFTYDDIPCLIKHRLLLNLFDF